MPRSPAGSCRRLRRSRPHRSGTYGATPERPSEATATPRRSDKRHYPAVPIRIVSSETGGRESVGVMRSSRKRPDDGALTRSDVGRLYIAGRDDLFRLAWLAVGDAHVAEEFVQEAYTRLYERPERVRDATKVDAYVRSIVLNLARSRFAKRSRRSHLDIRIRHDRTAAAHQPDSDPMRAADDRSLIAGALDSLSPNQRICVVCRYWLGLTDTETADATGMAVGTVKTHLRRALASLRKELSDQHGRTLEAQHVP